MDLRIELAGSPSGDLIRDLQEWISTESGSLGSARVRERAPDAGALGPVADAVQVVLSSVGVLSSLASVLVAWLQYRKADLELTIYVAGRHDPVRVSAMRAREDPQGARSELTAQLEMAGPVPPETDEAETDAG